MRLWHSQLNCHWEFLKEELVPHKLPETHLPNAPPPPPWTSCLMQKQPHNMHIWWHDSCKSVWTGGIILYKRFSSTPWHYSHAIRSFTIGSGKPGGFNLEGTLAADRARWMISLSAYTELAAQPMSPKRKHLHEYLYRQLNVNRFIRTL